MKTAKAIVIAFSAVASSIALGKNITVGPGAHADYHTIQAAVNAAHPGDDIHVQAGTYNEQVAVGAGLNNITIHGDNATIAPPASMTSGFLVTINGAQGVTLRGFTIAGPLPDIAFSSGIDSGGIFVEGGGSATIAANYITQIWQATASSRGIQNGIAILVGSQTLATTGSAAILNNTIDHWQKGAIVIDNTGSNSIISRNTITGEGPITYTAQNGVQVGDGATASVNNNTVSNLSYTPATYAASGILVFQTSNVDVSNNKIIACDLGVAFADVTNSEIDHNHISDGLYGLDIDQFYTGSQMNRIDNNDSMGNSQEGVYVSVGSVNNQFDHDNFRNNAYLDAEDDSVGTGDAGTGNDWDHNHIGTASPAGLES